MTYPRLHSRYVPGFPRIPHILLWVVKHCGAPPSFLPYRVNAVPHAPGTCLGRSRGRIYVLFIWLQVKNFSDVHPDYGARIQALLDKYNAEKPKVSPQQPGCGRGRGSRIRLAWIVWFPFAMILLRDNC